MTKEQIQNTLNDALELIMEAQSQIEDLEMTIIVEKDEPEYEEDLSIQPEGVTLKELSLSLTNMPDFYLTNPEQFAKMRPFYDPEKEPFTTYTWGLMVSYAPKDNRAFLPVEFDGVMYRKYTKQYGPEWYWIARGIKDVTAAQWYKKVIDGNLDEAAKLENMRTYKGDRTSSPRYWRSPYKEAYLETHS